MSVTKTQLFTTSEARTAELAKALGHPARIAILNHLSSGMCICGDITEALPLAQSTVSQHLKALKASGLIQGTVDGAKVCYCLDPETIREAEELLNGFISTLSGCCTDIDTCCNISDYSEAGSSDA